MTGETAAQVAVTGIRFGWPGMEEPLFEDVTLTFPGGSTTCIIGPNGAGKTTLLELILGWRRALSGRICLDGREVSLMSAGERGRTVALVPQDERLSFQYSVLEYVMLGRAPHLPPLSAPGAEERNAAMNALHRAGIEGLHRRPVSALSGGEKRLVLVARALVQEPRILLLDEPTNHLDPSNRERVIGILTELKNDSVTLLISSHEPDTATRLADHLVLLHRGLPPEMGTLADLMTAPKLSGLYGVPVRIVEAGGRRVIIWGDDP